MAAGEKVVEGGRKIRNICERNREIIFKGIFKLFLFVSSVKEKDKERERNRHILSTEIFEMFDPSYI